MIAINETLCPECNGSLIYYDRVKRILLIKKQFVKHIYIRRFKCIKCDSFHRELPNSLLPYKQYEAEGYKRGHRRTHNIGYVEF